MECEEYSLEDGDVVLHVDRVPAELPEAGADEEVEEGVVGPGEGLEVGGGASGNAFRGSSARVDGAEVEDELLVDLVARCGVENEVREAFPGRRADLERDEVDEFR